MEPKKKFNLKEKLKNLSPDKQEELKQYVESVREIKRKINEMLKEAGGDMTGKTLTP